MRLLATFGVLIGILAGCSATIEIQTRQTPDKNSVDPSISERFDIKKNTRTAKNVILFVGDGMGVSTVTAARIFDGQTRGELGEENVLSFETFPHVALIKTYNTNQQVPDSAGTATAMHSGVKTRAGVIGIGPEAHRQNCREALTYPLETVVEIAEKKGKSTGVVTTTRLTHATPATTYAHLPERDWESNLFMPSEAWEAGCRDIAYQLAHFDVGDGIDVALGGGRSRFFGSSGKGIRRNPDDDLPAAWRRRGKNRVYVETADQLAQTQPGEQVLGLFSRSHLTYLAKREPDSTEPRLSEMTAKAIELLQDNDKGYYLLVEGGRIDHGHHDGYAGYSLLQAQEFAKAVQTALEMVDTSDTLVLVTADHSHSFTISGYPTRGNPILGLVYSNDLTGEPKKEPFLADDGLPYTTLGYMNGVGAVKGKRTMPKTGLHAIQQSLVPLSWPAINGEVYPSETHGGEDVALYALGPWAHLVGGVLEQQAIFHIIKYAYDW